MRLIQRQAVRNFLMTLDTSLPQDAHFANLEMDSILYGWSDATYKTIYKGITEAYIAKQELDQISKRYFREKAIEA